MAKRGVLYVATKHPVYVEEAFLSAASIKRRHPDLPITLFTDQTDSPLCGAGVFDDVRPVGTVTGVSSAWSEGQLHRLNPTAATVWRACDGRPFTAIVESVQREYTGDAAVIALTSRAAPTPTRPRGPTP